MLAALGFVEKAQDLGGTSLDIAITYTSILEQCRPFDGTISPHKCAAAWGQALGLVDSTDPSVSTTLERAICQVGIRQATLSEGNAGSAVPPFPWPLYHMWTRFRGNRVGSKNSADTQGRVFEYRAR